MKEKEGGTLPGGVAAAQGACAHYLQVVKDEEKDKDKEFRILQTNTHK